MLVEVSWHCTPSILDAKKYTKVESYLDLGGSGALARGGGLGGHICHEIVFEFYGKKIYPVLAEMQI